MKLLADANYHNLDEAGTKSHTHTPAILSQETKEHSIAAVQAAYVKSQGQVIPQGKNIHDREYVNEDDVYGWSGHVRWFRGTLATVQAGEAYNSEHELMFFHNPSIYLDYHETMRSLIFDDMILYGYLLPSWIPLLSRFQCRRAGADQYSGTTRALDRYHPYHKECMEKWSNVQHFVE